MLRRCAVGATVVTFLLVMCGSGHAFVGFPELIPERPAENKTVSVRVEAGICDTFVEEAGYPIISQTGNNIRIILESVHAHDPLFCNFPSGAAIFQVGNYSVGEYSLQVDRHYLNIFGDVIETIGTLTFTVTAPAGRAVGVPTLNMAGLTLLGVGIAIVAGWRRRRLST